MFFLPLQWCTAAVVEYRGEAALAGSAGHGVLQAADDGGQGGGGGDGHLWSEAGCAGLHCHCLHAVFRLPRVPAVPSFEANDTPYGAFVPDPPPERFLRPPLAVLV